MANDSVLELATIPQRHPRVGEGLLDEFGRRAIFRLRFNPVELPIDASEREVVFSWKSPSTKNREIQKTCEIGWSNLGDPFLEDRCRTMALATPGTAITEGAAILIMALLLHEFESETIESVLPIGSGGDYFLSRRKRGQPIQVEVSGIRKDQTKAESRSRLGEKCKQVLQKSNAGFASVTTFSFGKDRMLHSFLYYVEKESSSKKTRSKSRRGKKK